MNNKPENISYLLAAELGDYDPVLHTPAFVSEFRFVPVQTEELEMEIVECYRHMRYVDIYISKIKHRQIIYIF